MEVVDRLSAEPGWVQKANAHCRRTCWATGRSLDAYGTVYQGAALDSLCCPQNTSLTLQTRIYRGHCLWPPAICVKCKTMIKQERRGVRQCSILYYVGYNAHLLQIQIFIIEDILLLTFYNALQLKFYTA
jgi:hypothetical protein